MCGRDIDSQQGLKAHYRACDVMNVVFRDLFEIFNQYSGDDEVGQLMNIHSITETLLQDIERRV